MDVLGIDHVTQRQSAGAEELKRSILERLIYSVGKDDQAAVPRDWFHATAQAARDHVVDAWMETTRRTYREDAKRVYYLSVEFLIGRLLLSSLQNLGILDDCQQALSRLGLSFTDVVEAEPDAALGNGGLGRLAACYLDSLATMGFPGMGYGIRYKYGLFEQRFQNGWQVEHPEAWLRYGNPWEFPRPEVSYQIPFYGRAVKDESAGWRRYRWEPGQVVEAMAFDMPVVGYGGKSVNTLRLWHARPGRSLDLDLFNKGDYLHAVEERITAEKLSWVLYPGDNTPAGKELRLRKEFFFTSASLQDILRRYRHHHGDFSNLPRKVAVQLNDTHPAIGVAEMMRLLIDEYGLEWDDAWELTQASFAYTNHTLLPEALESWQVDLFERVLPRHLKIIYDLNSDFLHRSRAYRMGDVGKLARISMIDEHNGRRVRMGHLAFIGSHRVNGVSGLHTELMKKTVFADLHSELPDRIVNVTNGITPRRWLLQANPDLAQLITSHLGDDWVRHLDRLQELKPLADDPGFREAFRRAKAANKQRLATFIAARTGLQVDTASVFDVQVKRIHEYKRQLLNILQTVALYDEIRANPAAVRVPVTKIFAGKAAPAYVMAKLVIKLINDVAAVVNKDPAVRDLLRVVYIPNYNVSAAEAIMPAADLSEQISTAGLEASGTGNMKFALNGALTIGTLDGANVEISEAVGRDNIFIFGLTAEEVAELRPSYDPRVFIDRDPALKRALDMIRWGIFSPDDAKRFHPLLNSLSEGGDPFFVCADFDAYRQTHREACALYGADQEAWMRKAVINTASMGWFTSDRSVGEYAAKIWDVAPLIR